MTTSLWATRLPDQPAGPQALWQLRLGLHEGGRYTEAPIGEPVPEPLALAVLQGLRIHTVPRG